MKQESQENISNSPPTLEMFRSSVRNSTLLSAKDRTIVAANEDAITARHNK